MSLNNVPSSYTKNYLPSKNILIIIGILVFAGILYFVGPKIYNFYQENKGRINLSGNPPEPLIASSTTTNDLDKDTDRDGIPDWKETLFGLNPKLQDSNGDGTPDELPMINGTSAGDLISIPDIGKFTLSIYDTLATGGVAATPDQLENVTAEKMLVYAENLEKGLKQYKMVDITLTDSTKETMATYHQTIVGIANNAPDVGMFTKNTQEYFLKNGPTPTKEITFLKTTITKLLATPVPTQANTLHLELINSAYVLLQILELPIEKRSDELNSYALSLIAQKNINLAAKTIYSIQALGNIYKLNQ